MTKETTNNEQITFHDLGLEKEVLRAIDDMGFVNPSPIQAEVIPVLLEGYDVIGQAQTGTGKTFAFGAPIVNNHEKGRTTISSLVITPTRELAVQVYEEISRIAKYKRLKLAAVYGGHSIDRQISTIRRGVDIVVGTPGRLIDLIKRNVLELSDIEFLVLDEADEMLDMGFIDDIEEIIKHTNKERQTLIFSATMPTRIKALAKRYMKKETKHVSVVTNEVTVSSVSQYYYEIRQKDRFETLCRVLDVEEPKASIIFCKTKRGVDEVVESMQSKGYNVEGMHGDMNQSSRLNTLRKFKEGSLELLVATDVAARGIDVENVTHVINYDLPQDTESYVHRIGRTGRANKTGVAYTLVTPREYSVLRQIERDTKGKITKKAIPTLDEIFETKSKGISTRINEALQKDSYKKFETLVDEISNEYDLKEVTAALMDILYSKEISYDYTTKTIEVENEVVRLFINIGKKDNATPKTLLKFIGEHTNVDGNYIENISILENFSFVNVNREICDVLMKKCSGKRFNGRRVSIEISNSKPRRR